MAPGGRPSDCALPQVPGVFPQTAAVHLVAAGDPHHQDRVLLHRPGLRQRCTTIQEINLLSVFTFIYYYSAHK